MRLLIFIFLLASCKSNLTEKVVEAPIKTGEYLADSLSSGGEIFRYRIMYPFDFDSKKTYPMLIFLHGAGERGSDNTKQLVHGSKLFLDSLKKYPAIVLFPQCAEDDYWSNVKINEVDGKRSFSFGGDITTKSMTHLMQLVDSMATMPFVDRTKISLAGLSMGGMGTFELLWRRPGLFRSAAAICGGGDINKAPIMAKCQQIRIFHGLKDDVVPPQHSIEMYEALQAAGANVTLTKYPEANHNSWDSAFIEPDFVKFLIPN